MKTCPHCRETVVYQGLHTIECLGIEDACPNGTLTFAEWCAMDKERRKKKV